MTDPAPEQHFTDTDVLPFESVHDVDFGGLRLRLALAETAAWVEVRELREDGGEIFVANVLRLEGPLEPYAHVNARYRDRMDRSAIDRLPRLAKEWWLRREPAKWRAHRAALDRRLQQRGGD